MHQFLKFIFGTELYAFWTSFLSIHPDPVSKQAAKPVWYTPIAVYTVLDSWWWTANLSKMCSSI